MTATVYGIKACDTMKRARSWLDAHSVDHVFHDYKTSGIDAARLRGWVEKVGWETVLNRKGTTFRKLSEEERSGLDAERAIVLMLAQPSLIKRPVIETGEDLLIGFDPAVYAARWTHGRA